MTRKRMGEVKDHTQGRRKWRRDASIPLGKEVLMVLGESAKERERGLRDQALMSFLLLVLMAEISRGEHALGK